MYEKILARSFSRYEQKKLRYAAFMAFLLMVVSFCTVFKPYLGPFPLSNLRMSMDNGLRMLMANDARKSNTKGNNALPESVSTFRPVDANREEDTAMSPEAAGDSKARKWLESEVSCNFTLHRSSSCIIHGDVRVNGISGIILVPQFMPDPAGGNNSKSWKLKPYARKTDGTAMKFVREWSVQSVSKPQELPGCAANHSVPAIIFSNKGYSGNYFHDFTDTLVPLFLNAKRFNGEVKFLVTNYSITWLYKYRKILKKLSKYEIIDIDKEMNIHCFPEVILGLTSQKELDVDPSMPPYSSLKEFTRFIREAYSLPRSNAINLRNKNSPKPRLMIISRKETRRLINIGNVVEMAKNVGYQVIVAEGNSTGNLAKFAESINSCDVLVGVHGAGLTNIVFLPENAVFIQIVPLALKWISNTAFGQPAQDMNLKYLDYQVTKEESSLIQQYPADHIIFRDPGLFERQGWPSFKAIYLDKQDVTVDVRRLQPLLEKAMQLLQQ